MTISMYQASVPVFSTMLNNLVAIMEKAAAHCEEKKIDQSVLVNYRLYPDMFAFSKQVQLAADHAKNATARLAGMEPLVYENAEKSFPELIMRVHKTIEYLKGFEPGQIDGSEQKEIVNKHGSTTVTYKGQEYLLMRELPNFFFHVTTAYDILRHNGVELGKKDFLGSP